MREETKRNIRQRISAAILKSWDDIADSGDDFPFCGDDIMELMADASANILIAISDSETYLKNEGMLKK